MGDFFFFFTSAAQPQHTEHAPGGRKSSVLHLRRAQAQVFLGGETGNQERAILVTTDYVKTNETKEENGFRLMMWSGEHGGKSTQEIYDAAPISTKGGKSWSQILRFHDDAARSAWIKNLRKACKTFDIKFDSRTGQIANLMHLQELEQSLRRRRKM